MANKAIVGRKVGMTQVWDDENRRVGVMLPAGGIVTNTFRQDGLRDSKADASGAGLPTGAEPTSSSRPDSSSARSPFFVFDSKTPYSDTRRPWSRARCRRRMLWALEPVK